MHKVTKQMQLLHRHTVKCKTGRKEEGGFDFPKKSMRRKKINASIFTCQSKPTSQGVFIASHCNCHCYWQCVYILLCFSYVILMQPCRQNGRTCQSLTLTMSTMPSETVRNQSLEGLKLSCIYCKNNFNWVQTLQVKSVNKSVREHI